MISETLSGQLSDHRVDHYQEAKTFTDNGTIINTHTHASS